MYRDTMRDFWRGQTRHRLVRAALHRLERPVPARRAAAVRVDQLRHRPRRLHAARPRLVQRQAQRGERRGQQDGTTDNRSWNCGVEGPTDDPAINELRARQQRNFLTTLLLSQGVPMLLGGDELGRTQGGNNNAYCQDNEISWFDWELDDEQRATARVHAAADRLPPPSPCLPAHGLPLGLGDDGLGRAGRLLVPAGRAQDDRAELVARRHAHARRLPERRRDPDVHAAGDAGDRRHVPDPLQRRTTTRSRSRCRRVAYGRRWAHELSTAEPELRGRARTSSRRAGSCRSSARSLVDPASDRVVAWRDWRCTYRLQLGPGLGFRAARGLVPYLRAARRLAPLPVAVVAGAAGLDARLRRRRPDPDLGRSRRRGRVPRALRRPGLGVVLDVVPNHMAADEQQNPFWRDPLWRAKFFDLDWRTGIAPPLLRRRRARPGCARRTRRCSRRCTRTCSSSCARGSSTGSGSTTRTGSPTRALPASGCASRESTTSGSRRSSSPASALRDWPIEGTTGLRVPERRDRALRRPGRRGAADRGCTAS